MGKFCESSETQIHVPKWCTSALLSENKWSYWNFENDALGLVAAFVFTVKWAFMVVSVNVVCLKVKGKIMENCFKFALNWSSSSVVNTAEKLLDCFTSRAHTKPTSSWPAMGTFLVKQTLRLLTYHLLQGLFSCQFGDPIMPCCSLKSLYIEATFFISNGSFIL